MKLALLKPELALPQYAGLSHADAAAKINVEATYALEFSTRSLPRREVKSWLIEIGKLTAILTGTDALARQFAFILTDSDYSEIAVFDPLAQQLFAQAVAAGLFTAQQRTVIENKAKSFVYLTARDVAVARLDDQAQAESGELETMRVAVSQKEFRVSRLQQGIDPDEEGGA
ncbi:hypothetical protein EON83_20290 [bacterium]|nr:MAG: hypothetical protein EON83_20290 [bacterium]